ncbi:hypothetical protein [Kordia sp.]|uniref:hypothetical protein n=1 Tax=Kordia sp. TaxID=1965332 RepID=UPI003D2AD0A5
MEELNQTETHLDQNQLQEQLLETHITLEKLKIVRKGILKDAAIIGSIGLFIILIGIYIQYAEWTEYPVIPFLIFVGGVFLAVALRPVQRFKKEQNEAEETRKNLQTLLKKDNLDYKAVVQVTKNDKGDFDVEKKYK